MANEQGIAERLYGAVRHVLNRAQTDPEFRWHMLGTESMEKLVAVEAEYLGKDPAELMEKRSEDAQPAYRKRRAWCAQDKDKVGELERRVEELELLLERHEIEIPQRVHE